MRDEWISVCGKKTVVIEKLREVGFSDQVSEKLIDFLTKEKNILCEDELYRMEQIYPKGSDSKMLGFMIMDYNYYLNIRVGTAFLLSLFVDNKIGLPVASGYLTVRGMHRLLEKITETDGTKCILLEILRAPNKEGKEDILMDFKGECCNNYLECNFRKDNRCTCTAMNVKDIMEQLFDMGILKKEGGIYRYSTLGSI